MSDLNQIREQLQQANQQAALASGAITQEQLALYHSLKEQANESMDALQRALEALSPQDFYALTRLHLSEQLVTEAVQHQEMYEALGSAEEQIERLFTWAYAAQEPSEIARRIAQLSEKFPQLIISIVSTPHPDVYVTPLARSFERYLATSVQDILMGQHHLSARDSGDIEEELVRFWQQVVEGKTLTPDAPKRQVTVQDENAADDYYWQRLEQAFEYVGGVIKTLARQREEREQDTEVRAALNGLLYVVQDELNVQKRTWTRGGDADGKPKATAEMLLQSALEEGSPILDLRQNAVKVHRPTVDALIAHAFERDDSDGHAIRKVFRTLFPEHQLTNREYLYGYYQALSDEQKQDFKIKLLESSLSLEKNVGDCAFSNPVFGEALSRLRAANQIIDGSPEEDVITRHKIANFETAGDFINLLLLMHEAGLITIEDGKVKQAKIDIMPLLETVQDLNNGQAIFSWLLDQDIIKSFYDARRLDRGDEVPVLTVMNGYSDSAKTSGFFAAVWGIWQSQAALAAFADEHGMKVELLNGGGQGMVRGGRIATQTIQSLLNPEMAASTHFDQTFQSNFLRTIVGSNIVEPQVAGIVAGTLLAALDHPLAKQGNSEVGELLGAIAQRSAENYDRMVFENHAIIRFIESIPANPLISSRPIKRTNGVGGEHQESLDDVRAVPVEYASHPASFPIHHIGLAEAIEAQGGWSRLQQAWQNHDPAVRALFTMIALDMRHFDAEMAIYHARSVGLGDDPDIHAGVASLQELKEKILHMGIVEDLGIAEEFGASPDQRLSQMMRMTAAHQQHLSDNPEETVVFSQAQHHATAATATDYMIRQNTIAAMNAMQALAA